MKPKNNKENPLSAEAERLNVENSADFRGAESCAFPAATGGGSFEAPAIEICGLSKRYKDVLAVDDLSLTVREGEIFSLLGVNGAGKTTTVKMLCCLTRPTSGDARVFGHSILNEPAAVKSLIAVSPQETAVAPKLSAEENLRLIADLSGLPKAAALRAVQETAKRLSLDSVMKKRAGTLSGGWKRRLSIAMALILNPKVLFLDEPTLGLDVIARADLWEVVRKLKTHTTDVLTTHYMEEAEALSDRVAVMKGGKLLAVGSVSELKESTGSARLEDAFLTLVGVRNAAERTGKDSAEEAQNDEENGK